jgi:CBS domain-containing protein
MKAQTQAQLTEKDAVVRLVQRAPVAVFLDTTLRACARVMEEESIGAVLVVSGHDTVGILSERDIVAAVAGGAGVDFHRARDYMTADVDTVPETATIGEAMAEMLRNEIRHLAVSREDRTIGLISIRDVLGALATA